MAGDAVLGEIHGSATRPGTALVGGDDEYRTLSTGRFPDTGGTALLSPGGRSVANSGRGRVVAPAQVSGVEVAYGVLTSGRTRAADPPEPLGPRGWRALAEVAAAGLRRRAARRRAARGT